MRDFFLIVLVMVSTLVLLLTIGWVFISAPGFARFTGNYKNNAIPENLLKHVKTLSSELPERSDDVDKLDVSAKYILNKFTEYSNDVYLQEYDVWGIPYNNVISNYGNSNCNGLYIIGAHYDAYNGLPGADDNASGVAGLIELARLFSISPTACAVQLVAYALEEPPYFRSEDMGSFYHAKSLSENKVKVELMVALEMIGYFSDEENSQQYPLPILKMFYPEKGNFIGLVSNLSHYFLIRDIKSSMIEASPLPVYSINAPPIIPGIDLSDHRNYWLFNYPAIMITDTAFYRNNRYHTEQDTWDTLDYNKMAMVVDAVYSAVLNHMKSNTQITQP